MHTLDAARAALAPCSPEWRAVLAAHLLAEALRECRDAGVLGTLVDTGALERALAGSHNLIEASK